MVLKFLSLSGALGGKFKLRWWAVMASSGEDQVGSCVAQEQSSTQRALGCCDEGKHGSSGAWHWVGLEARVCGTFRIFSPTIMRSKVEA